MKKKNIIIPLLFIASLLASSCNDFLDKMPDNRAELTNRTKNYPSVGIGLSKRLFQYAGRNDVR